MPYLQSDAIETIAYDEKARTLRARFRSSGRTVAFEGVPQELYDELLFADSIGAFVRQRIEGKYPARELGGDTPVPGPQPPLANR